MKRAGEIAKKPVSEIAQAAKLAPTREPARAPEPDPLPVAVMRGLWVRMIQRYGHRWVLHFGDSADSGAGTMWRKDLRGLTVEQVAAGLDACRLIPDDWPPSAPRFRALCLGIPSFAAVMADLHNPDRQPFTRLVWSYLNSYAYGRADVHAAQRMLQGAYAQAEAHRMRGGEFPPEPVAELEKPVRPVTPADPAVAKAELERMRRELAEPERVVDEDVGELTDDEDE